MSERKGNIVVVSPSEGVIIKGIERQLQGSGYDTFFAGTDSDKLTVYATTVDIFVIYLNGEVAPIARTIAHVDSVATEKKIPILVIGEKGEQEELRKTIITQSVKAWFSRPLDMEAFVDYIDGIIEEVIEVKAVTASRKSILIVDDDPMYGSIIAEWLSVRYNVQNVTSGMEAVSFLATEHADLILLDYEMPVLSGPKVLEMLRADAHTMNIPVVFLTGIGDKESISKVLAFKPQGYFLKTTPKEELLVWLSNFFKTH